MKYKIGYRGSEASRFARRIVRRVVVLRLGACWEWTGCKVQNGYGHFRPEGKAGTKPVRAHRWAWERVNGPVPDGRELDHICRNRACVRPSHMQAVTHLENMRRSPIKYPTHCKYGHPLSGDNLHVSKRGHRVCRACDNRRSKQKYDRQA